MKIIINIDTEAASVTYNASPFRPSPAIGAAIKDIGAAIAEGVTTGERRNSYGELIYVFKVMEG